MKANSHYHLTSSMNGEIVEIAITGEVTKSELDAIRAEVIKTIRETKAKAVIWDSRTATGPHEMSEAFFRTRSIPADIKSILVALVDQSANKEFQSFYELTAANTGLTLRYFTDIEAARDWVRNRVEEMRKK